MLKGIRKRATGVAIVAMLIITAVVAGCGDSNNEKTTRKVARKNVPEFSSKPPVSNAPKAQPV